VELETRRNGACFAWIESPLGRLLLVADDEGLREVAFAKGRTPPVWMHPGRPAYTF